MLYGYDKTIHKTGMINIERHPASGRVVSVWFRCMPLPFTDDIVNDSRAVEMLAMYKENPPNEILAIDIDRVSDEERELREKLKRVTYFESQIIGDQKIRWKLGEHMIDGIVKTLLKGDQ